MEINISCIPAFIDDFSSASGVCVNMSKSKIISSSVNRIYLKKFLPARWKLVNVVDHYKYLDILFDREVTIDEICQTAWKKFKPVLTKFMQIKELFSAVNRVVANTFMIPIFSYIFQFFLMEDNLSTKCISSR